MTATTARQPVKLAGYTPPSFTVSHVALDFTLGPASTIVRATLSLHRRAPGALRLDGHKLKLRGITINGEIPGDNRYELGDSGLAIHDVPDEFTLATEVEIAPQTNTELSGLYMSGSGFFTQCEPEGFRKITFFPDRPDVMARYHVTLRANAAQYPVLLCNGNLLAQGEENGQAWAQWEDPHPKPSYLFALVAANLTAVQDHFITKSGREVRLGIWVEHGDEAQCGHAMESLKRAMRWDEEVFGLEYDLDIFNIAAVSDFNAGAMENKGLNIFNTAYVLASAATATDADFQNVERVIAHEYFHNWTGNRVTCRDWFQLSLKEGLTVFRDQEYMASQFSAPVKRIADVRMLRTTQFRDDAGPLAHPVRPDSYLEINNFYTTTIYEKGAEVVRMIRTLIGHDAFYKGMAIYVSKNDNSAATVEDFVAAMQEAAPERDLRQIMLWYSQAGTPEISVHETYDAARKIFTLTFSQHTNATPGQEHKEPFLIPVAMGILDETGRDIHKETLVLSQAEQSFSFTGIPAGAVPSLFRDFSAPVRLKGQSPARLAFLAAHDTNLFNRWDALQQYASAVLLDAVAAHQKGQPFTLDDGLRMAIAATLNTAAQDAAFAAEALMLPAEGLLAGEMQVADPVAIHQVREAARRALGQALQGAFSTVYETFGREAADEKSSAAMAGRALKNTALAYLCAAGDTSRASAQFAAARNMTSQLAALANLADITGPARDEALAAFYTRWQDTPLVLDKWFAVQARSAAPDTLARVQALTTHEKFDTRNPNRVRALISSFTGNAAKFHDASGAGYTLLADMVLRLDPTNPQIAARLVTALGTWRRFDTARQALMRAALERLLARENLSHNSYEMASKALN